MKKIIAILLCLLLLTGCVPTDAPETTAGTEPQTNSDPVQTTAPTEQTVPTAPDFTVYDLEGNPVKLSDFVGKPVVLNFWASWCGPCKNEMPHFQTAYEKYGEDVQFLIVNLTDGTMETVTTAASYIDGCGYSFPLYFDTDSDAAVAYGVTSIPATYFIGDRGQPVAYGIGALDLQTLENGISMLLTEE